MPKFGVTARKEAELLARMAACDLRESDIEERFVSSQGPGGQHVNRSATCVQLRHAPTGLEVRAQEARSQALNRFYARRRLCELLEARLLGEASPEAVRREKIRRQKARRRRRHKAGGEEA
ncbi:MAG: peptide chain release factor-like protein [Candidatus Hydrogenedentes bacterium]|nr:peptide chain release factor-like protein [Candidatus Hydrogenedentota bacterium]